MNAQELLTGVNFEVKKFPAMVQVKDGYIPGAGSQVVRMDTGQAIAHVNNSYGVIQYADVFAPVVSALDGTEFEPSGVRLERNGARASVTLISKKRYIVGRRKNGDDDDASLAVRLVASHDGSTPVIQDSYLHRYACTNVLAALFVNMEDFKSIVRVRHTTNGEIKLKSSNFAGAIAQMHASLEPTLNLFDRLARARVQLNGPTAERLIKKHITQNKVKIQEVMTLAARGRGQDGQETAWALYNGATQYLTDRLEKSKAQVSSHGRFVNHSRAMLADLAQVVGANV